MSLSLLRPLVVLGLVALAASSADAQTDARLIGSWDAVRVLGPDGEETPDSNDSVTMTFTEDGRLLMRLNEMNIRDAIKVSYRVEGNVIVVIDEDGEEQRIPFRFEGDELALSPDTGQGKTAYLRRVPE